jgi:hypothetical protein
MKRIKLFEEFINESKKKTIAVLIKDGEMFEEFFKEYNLDYSKKVIEKPKEMFGMMKQVLQFTFDEKTLEKAISLLNNTDLNYSIINEQFIESQVNEATINYFKPDVLDKKNELDEKFFAKLMPKTSATAEEAMEKIWFFEGDKMFVHYQYFIVRPNGNKPDRPTYKIHNSQYWLSSAYDSQIAAKGLDPKDGVNVTQLTIYKMKDGITNPFSSQGDDYEYLGEIFVDTKVYLDEQRRVFEILNRTS